VLFPGREDADHIPADQLFSRAGLLHCSQMALVPRPDEARDIVFAAWLWAAAHGYGLALLFVDALVRVICKMRDATIRVVIEKSS